MDRGIKTYTITSSSKKSYLRSQASTRLLLQRQWRSWHHHHTTPEASWQTTWPNLDWSQMAHCTCYTSTPSIQIKVVSCKLSQVLKRPFGFLLPVGGAWYSWGWSGPEVPPRQILPTVHDELVRAKSLWPTVETFTGTEALSKLAGSTFLCGFNCSKTSPRLVRLTGQHDGTR